MQLSLYTWDGNAINDGTNYRAVIPPGQSMPTASPQYVERSQSWPFLAGKNIGGSTLTIKVIMLGTIHSQLAQLKEWFRSDDFELKNLIAKDLSDSNREWYVQGFVVSPPVFDSDETDSAVVIQLALVDPLWRENTQQSDTWTIAASTDTNDIAVRGNYPALPIFEITPTSGKSTGYAYKRFVKVYNNAPRAFNNYPISFSLDTAALISSSDMQADMDDLRLFIDGREANRWLYPDTAGSSDTDVWFTINLAAAVNLTIYAALASTDATPDYIQFQNNTANNTAIANLPSAGIVLINNEIFSYDSVDTSKRRIYIVERASRGTTSSTYSAVDTCRLLQHDIWLYYGNPSVGAPTVNDEVEPIIDFSASTNTSWKYLLFRDSAGKRPARWSPKITTGATNNQAFCYTGDHTDTDADPATEIGLSIQAYRAAGVWKAGNGDLQWMLYHPGGMTHFTGNADRWRDASSWPDVTIERSNDASTWVTKYTIATPTNPDSWTSLAIGSTSLGGTFRYIRFHMKGTVAAVAGNDAACEFDDFTVTLNSTLVPYIGLVAALDNYFLDCKITNETTGDFLTITSLSGLNKTITVDCEKQTAYDYNGENLFGTLEFSSNRAEWLTLDPTTNTLSFEDTGTNGLTIVTKWRGRSLL